MKTLDQLLTEAAARGLCELSLRESVGGWQAIAKYRDRRNGPWDVGCDPNPVTAVHKALSPVVTANAGSIFD